MNSSEDEDYMKFEIKDTSKTETYKKRRNKVHLDAMSKNKKSKVQEVQLALEKQKPIQKDNKGFQMLEKLGFKPGTALGKNGISEPIQVELKSDRSGLGKSKSLKSKMDYKLKTKEQQQDYIENMSLKFDMKLVDADLKKARLAIMTSDEQHGKTSIYWPDLSRNRLPDIDGYEYMEPLVEDPLKLEFENLPSDIKLEECVEYLRQEYLYCIWCGTVFADDNDLLTNCPGITRLDHDD